MTAPSTPPGPPPAAREDDREAFGSSPGTLLAPPPVSEKAYRRRLTTEIWIVLGLSLGRSGIYALVAIIDKATRQESLSSQVTTLNPSRSARPWLDLTYQLLQIGFALIPVALALYLLSANGRSAVRRIGLTFTRPLRDLGVGVALAACIGIPGLALYAVALAAGVNTEVHPAALNAAWWTVPVLLFAAVQNALLEEVIVVGYLMERLRELRWKVPLIIAASALLRGSYHLYQGWGGFVGNAIMGVLFAFYYTRRRRVMPLVVAHTIMDTVVFVGYSLVPAAWLAALHFT
ncbi:CPBP family intramembrane glutamic endopeptidase [Cellulomonas sp. URHE0023]|uniref:CPBP family intramembrane glutamic endopeptidase n=1 Tax=Cellulomonas sp. URHE0023 TaxID=1380354 RepID=UPI0009DCE1BF|nr:CPBP family intramembrane glutamic endopeptidase [Cellulomonas sp. URHE0023]